VGSPERIVAEEGRQGKDGDSAMRCASNGILMKEHSDYFQRQLTLETFPLYGPMLLFSGTGYSDLTPVLEDFGQTHIGFIFVPDVLQELIYLGIR
jgi:hypothetical protein